MHCLGKMQHHLAGGSHASQSSQVTERGEQSDALVMGQRHCQNGFASAPLQKPLNTQWTGGTFALQRQNNWLKDLGSPHVKLTAEQELTVLNFRLVNGQVKFSVDKGKATTHGKAALTSHAKCGPPLQ